MVRTLILFATLAAAVAFAQDPARDIVKKALDVDNRDWQRAKDYTYRQQEIIRESDGEGRVKTTRSRTHDVLILYGRPYQRLIEKDGKPLTASEERKEQERLDKEMDKRRRNAEDANSKERRDYEKHRAEQRKYVSEILDAFDFRLAGEDNLAGRPAWIIEGTPRPGYQPRDSRAKMLSKLQGRMWSDKAANEWVKVETDVTGTISIGLFLARISQGSSIRLEKRRVNDEVWLPSHVEIALEGRLALLKKVHAGVEIRYSEYRKFQADSRVVATDAVP